MISVHALCLYQQLELMGQSIYEFAHPRDEDEIQEALSVRPHGPKAPVTEERVFFLRLKCTLTSKGRNVNLKSASYKVGVESSKCACVCVCVCACACACVCVRVCVMYGKVGHISLLSYMAGCQSQTLGILVDATITT